MMLQINTAGSWRNVFEYSPDEHAQIMDVVQKLMRILGTTGRYSAKWCVLHTSGRREWLQLERCASREDHFALGAASKGL